MANNKPQQIDDSVFAGDEEALHGTEDTEQQLPAGSFAIDLTTIVMEEIPVPAGMYEAQIVGAKATKSKNSGNPMIVVRWKITQGEHTDRTITDYLVFSQPTGDWNKDYPLRKIRNTLESIGYSPGANGVEPEALIGEPATLKVSIQAGKGVIPEGQPNAGKPRPPTNKIDLCMPAGNSRTVADLL